MLINGRVEEERVVHRNEMNIMEQVILILGKKFQEARHQQTRVYGDNGQATGNERARGGLKLGQEVTVNGKMIAYTGANGDSKLEIRIKDSVDFADNFGIAELSQAEQSSGGVALQTGQDRPGVEGGIWQDKPSQIPGDLIVAVEHSCKDGI